MALVTWLSLAVGIIALLKIDFKEICVRLWHKKPLFAESDDKRRMRRLEKANEELEEKLKMETAAREREVDELRGRLQVLADALIKSLRIQARAPPTA